MHKLRLWHRTIPVPKASPEGRKAQVGYRRFPRSEESVGVMVAANPPPSFARRELQKILQREGPMAASCMKECLSDHVCGMTT